MYGGRSASPISRLAGLQPQWPADSAPGRGRVRVIRGEHTSFVPDTTAHEGVLRPIRIFPFPAHGVDLGCDRHPYAVLIRQPLHHFGCLDTLGHLVHLLEDLRDWLAFAELAAHM